MPPLRKRHASRKFWMAARQICMETDGRRTYEKGHRERVEDEDEEEFEEVRRIGGEARHPVRAASAVSMETRRL